MRKIKFGIAGLGRIGKIHLNNLLQINNADVIAVMDPNLDTHQFAQKKGILNIYDSYENFLLNDEIEAVVICSPTDSHAEFVSLAAKKGKHIFCEKPLDLSLDRVIEVLEIIKQTNVKLMLGFNRRFDKDFAKLKALFDQGAIGDHHLLKITSRDPKAPPLDYIKKSGGLFLDMTIHDFDMARFVVNKEVEEVYAKGAVFINPKIGSVGDIDTAVIVLTYKDGTIAVIDNSREASYGYDQRIEVFGSKGMLKAENNLIDSHKLYTVEGTKTSNPLYFFLERYSEAYKKEMESFISALENKSSVPVNGYDGLQSLLIGLAAIKSYQEKRPVNLAEMNQLLILK